MQHNYQQKGDNKHVTAFATTEVPDDVFAYKHFRKAGNNKLPLWYVRNIFGAKLVYGDKDFHDNYEPLQETKNEVR